MLESNYVETLQKIWAGKALIFPRFTTKLTAMETSFQVGLRVSRLAPTDARFATAVTTLSRGE